MKMIWHSRVFSPIESAVAIRSSRAHASEQAVDLSADLRSERRDYRRARDVERDRSSLHGRVAAQRRSDADRSRWRRVGERPALRRPRITTVYGARSLRS
jgi:hypothetical protein